MSSCVLVLGLGVTGVAAAQASGRSSGSTREAGGARAERSAARAAVTPAPSSAASAAARSAAAVPAGASAPAPAPSAAAVALPTSVRIPAIGVSSALVRLGRAADGSLEVPTSWTTAGWYAGGPAPGAVGPAVIAGHLDSRSGPGVFARLPEVVAGQRILVGRADGSTAAFVVTRTEEVAKSAFPTQEVYGPVAGPELRLITCGGAFDRTSGHYVDNVLVFARQV